MTQIQLEIQFLLYSSRKLISTNQFNTLLHTHRHFENQTSLHRFQNSAKNFVGVRSNNHNLHTYKLHKMLHICFTALMLSILLQCPRQLSCHCSIKFDLIVSILDLVYFSDNAISSLSPGICSSAYLLKSMCRILM